MLFRQMASKGFDVYRIKLAVIHTARISCGAFGKMMHNIKWLASRVAAFLAVNKSVFDFKRSSDLHIFLGLFESRLS